MKQLTALTMFLSILTSSLQAQSGHPLDPGGAADGQRIGHYISILDPSIISEVDPEGRPRFSDPAISDAFVQAGVTGFHQAFPGSRMACLRDVYAFITTDTELGERLEHDFPALFGGAEPLYRSTTLTDYEPNDYDFNAPQWPVRVDYLHYIGAPTAWGVSHGDPDVVVGVSDGYVDLNNPDIANKYVRVVSNGLPYYDPITGTYDPEEWSHATLVAGLAAGATDNHAGYPSMGFDCMLDLSDLATNQTMLEMSVHGDRVLNASWFTTSLSGLYRSGADEEACTEIYENGTFYVAAAGNGLPSCGPADNYTYPASLDHVMSVSSEGWQGTYGVDMWNVQGVHEGTIGNSVDNCYQNNSQVDILAPALQIGGLWCDPTDPSKHYTWSDGWGTSFASPIVAGTAALMASANTCLSPYQLEYILKRSADNSILALPENLPYAGKLGAGGLRAGQTLLNVQAGVDDPIGEFGCNAPDTRTFYIEGVEMNTVCKPGFSSNGALPKMTPILRNGTQPYTYSWQAIPGNTTALDAYDIAEPTITTSTGTLLTPDVAYYRLTVRDGSPVQKVASRVVKAKLESRGYDLAMRDSYMDMFDEPNNMKVVDGRDWDIWHSPDVWNRIRQDGVTDHENPEYARFQPNYAYARIRNVGCETAPAAELHLYWTKASTGENWSVDWDGTTQVPASNGGVVPAGAEMTAAGTVPIPALAPGDTHIANSPWYPPAPQNFAGSPSTVDVCLLARLVDTHPLNEAAGNEKVNVLNNNNIVTRNLIVMDLDPFNRTHVSHQVDVTNAEAYTQTFTLQLINDKAINKHMAGDLSAVASIQLDLGPLFDRWVAGGQQGNVTGLDRERRTVTFDGTGSIELANIHLDPHERFPITCTITLNEGVELGASEFQLHLRQFTAEAIQRANEAPPGPDRDPEVYGDVSFLVRTAPGQRKAAEQQAQGLQVIGDINVYPNPANDRLLLQYIGGGLKTDVTLMDITGRIVSVERNVEIGTSVFTLDIADVAPGEYVVKATGPDGAPLTKKVTIRH